MKRFLIKLIIFIAPLFLLSVFLEKILDEGNKKTNFSLNYKEWNDIFESNINADLIIQGSSRAWLHISPAMIDSVFKLYSYNLGIDGYNFHMQYYRYLIYLKFNKKPKYIIQSVDETTLCKYAGLYMKDQFIPYLDDPLMREAVSKYEGLDDKDFNIPCYKYIGNKDLILNGLFASIINPVPIRYKYKGFREIDMKWDTAFSNFKKNHPTGYRYGTDTMTMRLFDNFVKKCKEENIKLIFVNTPEFIEAQKIIIDRDSITNIYKKYSKEFNIPFLDYSNDSICLDTLNFYNGQHLNSHGVDKFNLKFANDLRGLIK